MCVRFDFIINWLIKDIFFFLNIFFLLYLGEETANHNNILSWSLLLFRSHVVFIFLTVSLIIFVFNISQANMSGALYTLLI